MLSPNRRSGAGERALLINEDAMDTSEGKRSLSSEDSGRVTGKTKLACSDVSPGAGSGERNLSIIGSLSSLLLSLVASELRFAGKKNRKMKCEADYMKRRGTANTLFRNSVEASYTCLSSLCFLFFSRFGIPQTKRERCEENKEMVLAKVTVPQERTFDGRINRKNR